LPIDCMYACCSGDYSIHVEEIGVVAVRVDYRRSKRFFLKLLSVGSIAILYRVDLLQPATMAFLSCEHSSEIRGHQLSRQFGTNHTSTQHQDVHVVVFHSLVGGICVVTEPCANARHFVGGHRGPDSTAADQHASVCRTVDKSSGQSFGKVGIVHGLSAICPDIQYRVAKQAYIVG